MSMKKCRNTTQINKHNVFKPLAIIVSSLVYIIFPAQTAAAVASDVTMLEKIYELDAVMSAGVCPDELKRIRQTTTQDFSCDRVRIDYGYRSNELVQCNLRKNLANEIINEYNHFIEACKSKE